MANHLYQAKPGYRTPPPSNSPLSIPELEIDDEKQDKFLVGILLKLKTEGSFTFKKPNIRSTGRQYNNAAKTTQDYKRMFTFGDLNSKGRCFTILERNNSDTGMIWRQKRPDNNVTIGDVILISEPSIASYISDNVPIIETDHPFCVVDVPRLPTIEPVDAQPGKTNFFILNGRGTADKIAPDSTDLFRLHSAIVCQSLCSGQFCDRQREKLEAKQQACGCYSTAHLPGHVMALDVTLKQSAFAGILDSNVNMRFQSWRMTKLLFDPTPNPTTPTSFFGKWATLNLIRTKLHDLITYVNAHGEWTVVGWYRLGEVTDAATGDDLVAAASLKIHVVVLKPSADNIGAQPLFSDIPFDFRTVPSEDEADDSGINHANNDNNNGRRGVAQGAIQHNNDADNDGRGVARGAAGHNNGNNDDNASVSSAGSDS